MDIIALSGALLNEVAERFERYCADYIRSMMPAFSVDREFKYPGSRKGTTFDSPEVLLEQDDILTVIIECKATKLTISAKFSDSPTEDAHQRYAEIARGVYQIWRFFAHTRMELTGRKFDEKTAGVVLTLDTWLVMGPVLRDHVMDVANALADADQDILDVDRRPVAFAAIQDFERLLSTSDETEVRAAIAASHQDRFLGWLLPSVASELNGTSKPAKPYPFSPENLVPWWSKFAD